MSNISVIIPSHNAQDYIARAIECVLNQTMQDVEVICVDDASSDDTPKLIKRYAENDSRVKMLLYTENKSAYQARKDGILMAQGKYTMFLDADDLLYPESCEILFHEIEENQVEILHFNSLIKSYGVSQARVENMERFVSPCFKRLEGNAVFKKCFLTNEYRFNLWNKIYLTELCKRAMENSVDGFYPKANDLLLFYQIAVKAKSYIGIDTEPLYQYDFGLGSTGSQCLDLKGFERYCYLAKTADTICNLPYEAGKEIEEAARKNLSESLLRECLWNWGEHLPVSLAKTGYEMLCNAWGQDRVISGLGKRYGTNCLPVLKRLNEVVVRKAPQKEIETVGIFYHRMAKGGVQRVISLLMPLYLKMGYKVVLYTEEYEPELEYEIPKEVKRVILPKVFEPAGNWEEDRERVFRKSLEEDRVDILLYQAASNRRMIYDILTAKSLDILFCVTVHELFSQSMAKNSDLMYLAPQMYRYVDRLIVLSETEKKYWKLLGIPATFIPNPIDEFEEIEYGGDYILWIGRYESYQKRYLDAVEIMRLVVDVIPEAHMKMVGNEVTEGATDLLRERVAEYGLEKNIEICDFQKDVKELYEHAQIHLVTSLYEAFPMTIIESKSYGIPLVTYEMPYLELLKEKQDSFIGVESRNIEAAADAVCMLLKDEELRKKMSKAAKESILKFAQYDLEGAWRQLFKECNERLVEESKESDDLQVILSTLLLHYEEGILNMQKEEAARKAELKDQKRIRTAQLQELQTLKQQQAELWERIEQKIISRR